MMKRLGLLVCLATALCAASGVIAAEKPTIDSIIAALNQQEKDCGPSLQVKYTLEGLTSSKSGTLHYESWYVRTPDILFKEEKKGTRKPDGQYEWGCGKTRYSFDRTLKVSKEISTPVEGNGYRLGVISQTPWPIRMGEVMDTVLFRMLGELLIEVIKKGNVSDAQESIDGHQCWRIDIPEKQLGTDALYVSYSIWADPKIGFNPRRITMNIRKATGPKLVEHDFTDYKALSAKVYFPMRIISKYDRSGTNGWIMKAQEASCGKKVAPEDISVVFPSGMKVRLLPDNVEATIP